MDDISIAHASGALLGAVLLLMTFAGIYSVPEDESLLVFFLRRYIGVMVPKNEDVSHCSPGATVWKTHIGNWAILPWPVFDIVFMPRTAITLRYHLGRVYTSEGIPVLLTVTIIISLGLKMDRFFRTFNILGKGLDLASEQMVEYTVDRDPDTQERKTQRYNGTVITQELLDTTEPVVHESMRRVAESMTWAELRGNTRRFEDKMRELLAEPESVFAKGELLRLNAFGEAEVGPALVEDGFELNLNEPVPSDEEYFNSLSAPAKGRNLGEEEGNRIQEIVARTRVKPEFVIGNETLRKTPELTIINSEDSLMGIIEGLITGRGSKKKGP